MEPQTLSQLTRLIPFLIPVILIQVGLLVWALIDLVKQPAVRGQKWVWALVIVFVNIIGPIVYFVFGRKEN
jgi:hypothetical protein